MDYDKEEQAFYSRLDADPLSDSAIALWHALRVISKVVGRTEGLSVPQGTLCSKAGLRNPKSLERARNQLTSKGIIEWKARGKEKATIYSLMSITRQNEAQNVTRQNEAQNGVHSGVQNGVRDHQPLITEEEVAGLQDGLDAVERLAREIGMNHCDIGTINRIVADYTADWCIQALNRARVNAKGVPSWRYVEAILRNWREAGGIDEPSRPQPEESNDDQVSRTRYQAQSEKILRGEYD